MIIAQEWVTFTKSTPEAPVINLIGSGNQQVVLTVEVCGMFKQVLTEQGETFQRIEIPGAGKSMEPGKPELPYIRQLIAIPECNDVILTVNITGQTSFSNYNVYPSPNYEEVLHPDGSVFMQEIFTKDETAYGQNIFLPGINTEIISTGYLRDQKYAEVYIYPIQFNPVSKQLVVYTNFQIILSFTNPASAVNVNTGIFNNVATHTLLNYVSSGITASINDKVQGNGNIQWINLTDTAQACTIVADYLIICAEPFFEPNNPDSEVLRIAKHRATYNGFDVAIINANTIISDGLGFYYEGLEPPQTQQYKKEQRIRTCIRRIYEGTNAQHTYDGKLGYMLLIGDSEYGSNLGMPASFDHSFGVEFPSDYYYSCLTKEDVVYDPIGDLFIGRFCVDNNDQNGMFELHNFVEKTIYFETEYTFNDWRDNVINIYGYNPDNPTSSEIYFDLYEDFMNTLFMNNNTFTVIDATTGNNITQNIIDSFNEGCNYGLYCGHGVWNMWTNNTGEEGTTTITELQEGLTNNLKTPIILSLACQTGWFDGNFDCFGEALTTYSPDKGFVGFLGSSRNVYLAMQWPINEPIEFQEWLPYSIYHNLSFVAGEFILEAKINALVDESIYHVFNYFGDPALNIMAHGFQVTHDVELPETTIISTPIVVKDGAQLKIPSYGNLFFESNGILTIEEGATLCLMPHSTITGNSPHQKISVEGNITVYSNSIFNSMEGTEWEGIVLNNLSKNYYFSTIHFENCHLSGESKKLTVNSCSFYNSGIKYTKGDLIVQNSNFNNSRIEATYGNSKSSFVEIQSGCTIQNCESEPAIYIDSYYKYTIDDCTISGNNGDAIGIYNSGSFVGVNDIKNNTITNNGWVTTGSGIELYRSFAKIFGNQLIEGNIYGITSFDRSNVSVSGNELANYVYETQIIRDNNKHQVLATQNSFPFYFNWNAIYDEDNTYPLVYYSSPVSLPLNVTNNYWGNNFTPQTDLYPYQDYSYFPIWQLNSGGSGTDDELLYKDAHNEIEQGNFSLAKSYYKELTSNFPNSIYAQAAMRELFSIEEEVTNDYSDLKYYYLSDTSVAGNSKLAKLAGFLANFCEIKLENYPTAITWFEDVIQNPESFEDSIFAIIDLGYTYWLMENGGLKSNYVGNMPQYKFPNQKEYEDNRDYLLSLVPGDNLSETMKENINALKTGELLQNVPNPFNNTTQIWYKLNEDAVVTVSVFDYTGKRLRTLEAGRVDKGSHFIEFSSVGLPAGIYFYCLEVNGRLSDSKKMTVMR